MIRLVINKFRIDEVKKREAGGGRVSPGLPISIRTA